LGGAFGAVACAGPPVDLARVGHLSHLHRPRVGAIGSVRKVALKLVAINTQMG
jgi:hypothetical protein